MPEQSQYTWDEKLWLHKEAAAITVTQDGSVAAVPTTALLAASGNCALIEV